MNPDTHPDSLRDCAASMAGEHFDLAQVSESEGGALYRRMLAELAASGLLRHCVPQSFGGIDPGVRCQAICSVREGLAYAHPLADLAFIMQAVGSYPVTLAGSEELRSRLLPSVANGTAVAALAMTEPEAGSDILSIRTTARRVGEEYEIEGVKTYISNAGLADFYAVFARTSGSSDRRALSAFVIRADDPGFEFRRPIEMIAPHPIGEIGFDRCRIPRQRMLGAEGDGFEIAMKTLNTFRPAVGAAALGMAQRAFDESVRFARARKQFGRAIAEFQGIQFKLADMATELDAARLLVYRAADRIDRGSDDAARHSAMAKLFSTEAAQRIIDQAVQIHGAQGLVKGAVIERLYREIRAMRIYEGTSEIQRNVIAREILRSG